MPSHICGDVIMNQWLNVFYLFVQTLLGQNKVKQGQTGSDMPNGAKRGQTGVNRAKWGQAGPKGAKHGQPRSNGVK